MMTTTFSYSITNEQISFPCHFLVFIFFHTTYLAQHEQHSRQWDPNAKFQCVWLLLCGANSHFAKGDDLKDSSEDDYLLSAAKDIQIVNDCGIFQQQNHCKLKNKYINMDATKQDALNQIVALFEAAAYRWKPNLVTYVNIYYTGHGVGGNGNWWFHKGSITLKDILNIANHNKFRNIENLHIYSDCCQSGNWCQELRNYKNKINPCVCIFASSRAGCTSKDSKMGSYWTRYIFNSDLALAQKMNLQWTSAALDSGKYCCLYEDAKNRFHCDKVMYAIYPK
eukprot:280426_1